MKDVEARSLSGRNQLHSAFPGYFLQAKRWFEALEEIKLHTKPRLPLFCILRFELFSHGQMQQISVCGLITHLIKHIQLCATGTSSYTTTSQVLLQPYRVSVSFSKP